MYLLKNQLFLFADSTLTVGSLCKLYDIINNNLEWIMDNNRNKKDYYV